MARYKLGGGYGAGSGLVANGANLDNQLITGKAGGQTLLAGLNSGDSLIISTNPSQNGQVFFGTIGTASANSSYFQDNPASAGNDNWQLRSGKASGGNRQVVTLSNRGNAVGDNISMGFGPTGAAFSDGGTAISKCRQEFAFQNPNNIDQRFYVGVNGTAVEALRLDGLLGLARIASGLQLKRTATTTTYTVLDTDLFITGDATGGAYNITLPSATTRDGSVFIVKRISSAANNVTVKSSSGTLDGVAAATGIPLTAQYMTRIFESDGTNWHVIGGYL